jgi:hypothetical protein
MDDAVRVAYQSWFAKQSELMTLNLYPPFAEIPTVIGLNGDDTGWPSRTKIGEELANDIEEETNRVENESENSSDLAKTFERPYSHIEVKYETDLEEARLYQKRYPDREDALEAVYKKQSEKIKGASA